jgi:hypothetical protein
VDVCHGTVDDIACRINNKAQATPPMKESEASISGVPIDATFTQACDFSFTHQKLNDRRLNRKAHGDDGCIDADCALFEFHAVHTLNATVIAPMPELGLVWRGFTLSRIRV